MLSVKTDLTARTLSTWVNFEDVFPYFKIRGRSRTAATALRFGCSSRTRSTSENDGINYTLPIWTTFIELTLLFFTFYHMYWEQMIHINAYSISRKPRWIWYWIWRWKVFWYVTWCTMLLQSGVILLVVFVIIAFLFINVSFSRNGKANQHSVRYNLDQDATKIRVGSNHYHWIININMSINMKYVNSSKNTKIPIYVPQLQ